MSTSNRITLQLNIGGHRSLPSDILSSLQSTLLGSGLYPTAASIFSFDEEDRIATVIAEVTVVGSLDKDGNVQELAQKFVTKQYGEVSKPLSKTADPALPANPQKGDAPLTGTTHEDVKEAKIDVETTKKIEDNDGAVPTDIVKDNTTLQHNIEEKKAGGEALSGLSKDANPVPDTTTGPKK